MTIAVVVVSVVVLIGAAAVVGPRIHVPVPLLLAIAGTALAFIPGFPRVQLDPELVLTGLLPPLLYSAAIRTSLVDFKENVRAVLLLAVGLVAFTGLAVAFALAWAVPFVGFAAALALGAVVAPPDAVSTSALAKTIGMPRRMTALLSNESLLNDAAALVLLGVATSALTGRVDAGQIGLQLLIAAGGGVAVGVAVGYAVGLLRRTVADPILATLISFAVPYLAFLPAEALGASGVLAVVVAGLILAHSSPRTQTARTRVTEQINWNTIAFALENGVFVLIGLQVPAVLTGVREYRLSTILTTCAVVVVVVIAARFVWMFAYWGVLRLVRARSAFPVAGATAVGWAGMRGVVTLAAALLLPAGIPERPVLQLAALVVVAVTLLVQGLTLGPLVRTLGMRGPDAAEDTLQAAALLDAAAKAANIRLDELLTGNEPSDVIASLRSRVNARAEGAWERLGRSSADLEPPTAVYRRLRIEMIAAEREVILSARDRGAAEDDVLRSALGQIDAEESMLDPFEDVADDRATDLVPAARGLDLCRHLANAPLEITPSTPGVCEDCIREGTTWVHLRTCLTCGHVGCCDSSERRHAEAHFHSTGHPVMRSAEAGEAWRWCYVDERLG